MLPMLHLFLIFEIRSLLHIVVVVAVVVAAVVVVACIQVSELCTYGDVPECVWCQYKVVEARSVAFAVAQFLHHWPWVWEPLVNWLNKRWT